YCGISTRNGEPRDCIGQWPSRYSWVSNEFLGFGLAGHRLEKLTEEQYGHLLTWSWHSPCLAEYCVVTFVSGILGDQPMQHQHNIWCLVAHPGERGNLLVQQL